MTSVPPAGSSGTAPFAGLPGAGQTAQCDHLSHTPPEHTAGAIHMNNAHRFCSPSVVSRLLGGLAAISLGACAAGPAASPATDAGVQITHLCKPQETVGFSCALADQRVLSLCGSPGFVQFQGKPADNPGYAYVVIGSRRGQVQFQHPQNPQDYKKYMSQTVSVSAQQNMFVTTEQGAFLQFAMGRDVEANEQAMIVATNAPPGWWSLPSSTSEPRCVHRYKHDNLAAFMSQMVDDPDWAKRRGGSR